MRSTAPTCRTRREFSGSAAFQATMPRLLTLILVFVLVPAAAAQARVSLVDVPVTDPGTVGTLERLGLDVTHDVNRQRARVLLHDDADRRALTVAGLTSTEVIADVEAYHRRSRELDAERARTGERSSLPSGREVYRVLDEYYDELDGLAAAHPGLVRRVSLPKTSVEGRELAGVEIAGDVNRKDDGRPVYVVMGAHHAREWPSAEVNMEFALDLAGKYGSDPRITALLDKVRVYVFPVINPDGFVDSRGEIPLSPLPGTDPLQRKNANEVDLNRNYGAYWGGNGASTQPDNDTYRGPSPFSEPESQAVHEFSQKLHITNFQTIHNIAALVLRPPGFRAFGLAPDEDRLKLLGDKMGEATGYSSEYGYQLYEVTGATEDWNYVAQNSFGYTIELGPSNAPGTFQGPYQTHVVAQYLGDDLSQGGEDGVREALLLAGEQAGDTQDHSVLEGSATPGATLRLTKTFKTSTSPICQPPYNGGSSDCPTTGPAMELDDGLDTQLTVPADGSYEWHVAPSTRPFERKAGRTESWTMTCTAPDGTVLGEQLVTVAIGERKSVDPCAEGSRPVGVATSGGVADDDAGDSGSGSGDDGSAGGTGTGTGQPSGSSTAPSISSARGLGLALRLDRRQRLSTILQRGVLVRATCDVDCTLGSSVRRSPLAAAPLGTVLGKRTLRLRANKRAVFRVKLSRAARRYLVRRRAGRVTLRLDARSGAQRRAYSRSITLVSR